MNSNLQNKLLSYEAEPPAHVWDAIAATLENNNAPSYIDKLYHFQQAPPPNAWQQINEQLDVAKPSKILFLQNSKQTIKYAAAMLLIAALSSILFVNRTSTTSTISSHIPTEQLKKDLHQKIWHKPLLKTEQLKELIFFANRYVVLSNAKGVKYRVSKKVFDCIQQQPFKHNIPKLQQKINTSSVAASTDFMAVIDIIKVLQQQQ